MCTCIQNSPEFINTLDIVDDELSPKCKTARERCSSL